MFLRLFKVTFMACILATLIVACGGGGGNAPNNRITAALAGANQNVRVGTLVTLDGSRSTGADGRLITYNWAFKSKPSGSSSILSDATVVKPTFVPDVAGDYVLSLVVNDGVVNSAPSTATVTASKGNSAPVANAGTAQNVVVNTPVTLDGSLSSDADNDLITYKWSISEKPAGSNSALADGAVAKPTFTPDLPGNYVLSLIVNDGEFDSAAATATITASLPNAIPLADAGTNQNVLVGATVNLDGSRSSDANGDLLTYSWSFTSKPDGSNATLSNDKAVNPTFIADLSGDYVLNLVVNDGKASSTTAATVVIKAAARGNSAPVANAGVTQNVRTGTLITMDGSKSSDADGDLITYSWTIASMPDGSNAVLSDATVVNPTFTADLAGVYVLNLIVNDGKLNSEVATVTINAEEVNAIPVADAGVAQNVRTGTIVTLDGSKSSDADGDLITYKWAFVSMPAGSSAALSNANVVSPTFTADSEGAYVLNLVVNDGKSDSATATVTINASKSNSVPVANASTTQNVLTGAIVTLDGSKSSDADGDLLNYSWSFTSKPAGSNAVLSDATIVNPSFTADVAGTYVLNLVVNDGKVNSEPVSVTINAGSPNIAPVANAGSTQNVLTGSIVTLDGSGSSDANNDLLTYSWTITSKPAGSNAALSDGTVVNPVFTADVTGTYVLSLVVNDGEVNSEPVSVTINASYPNAPPVANAGSTQNVLVGTLVTLDGSGSSDANNDPLTYSWTFTSKPAGSTAGLSSSTAANPTFTADLAGAYVIKLVVNDGTVSSTSSTVMINASTPNVAPVAKATASGLKVRTGTKVTLSGSSSSDADGDPLTYSWAFTSIPAGSNASLSNSQVVNPTFTADVSGTYVLNLRVNDGKVDSTATVISITASNDVSLLFNKSATSSGRSINGYLQPGTKFVLAITNMSTETFNINRAELTAAGILLRSTTVVSDLNGGKIMAGETVSLEFALNSDNLDSGLRFTYYLTDPVTGNSFTIYNDYASHGTGDTTWTY